MLHEFESLLIVDACIYQVETALSQSQGGHRECRWTGPVAHLSIHQPPEYTPVPALGEVPCVKLILCFACAPLEKSLPEVLEALRSDDVVRCSCELE